MAEFITKSAAQTEKIGRCLGEKLKSGDIVAIFGEMGAGKTAFVRGLATGLGIKTDVSSPTFALVNEYPGNPPLYHFDMFRVVSWEDLYSTGFFDYIDTGGIIAIEWSENIAGALPKKSISVEIEILSTLNERNIIISEEIN